MSIMKGKHTAAVGAPRTPRVASQRKAAQQEAELPDAQVAAVITESVVAEPVIADSLITEQATAVIEAQAEVAESAAIASVALGAAAGTVVVLPENCTLRDALAMKTELLAKKDIAEAVTVEIAAVKRIETANLQVLAAFVRDRRNAGLTVQWSGASEAMSQAVKLLGLQVLLPGCGASAQQAAA